MTINELRAVDGLPPVSGGDSFPAGGRVTTTIKMRRVRNHRHGYYHPSHPRLHLATTTNDEHHDAYVWCSPQEHRAMHRPIKLSTSTRTVKLDKIEDSFMLPGIMVLEYDK